MSPFFHPILICIPFLFTIPLHHPITEAGPWLGGFNFFVNMSEYQFFLASTYRGENCDWQYDAYCESLLSEDAHGNKVVADECRLYVKLFLDACWMDMNVKRWLMTMNGYKSDMVNEAKFVRLIGWMNRVGMFVQHLGKHELAHFVFENVPLERFRSERSVITILSQSIRQQQILPILEQKSTLLRG